jgi:hypothetical protein
MDAVITIGSPVRYPRTGTEGHIVRIEERGGFSYAELDSTGMLYRTDLLTLAVMTEKVHKSDDRSEDLKQAQKEREISGDMSFQEIPNLDSACNGAG